MLAIQEQFDLILGPQIPIGSTWFDTTSASMAKTLGQSCPTSPPTDPTALNDYVLHAQYYDLGKSEYILRARTKDQTFQTYAWNAIDSWWKHPQWIQSGAQRDFYNGQGPPPRHAGVGGLILRAIDGRPEMWDWIIAYVRASLDIWLLFRINNSTLWVDIREGAFTLKYAVWLSQALPDSYPLQTGGVATDGAGVRAEMLAKAENVTVNYYQRLQYPCGCWRYDSDLLDTPADGSGDGSALRGITQPFTIGLLMDAFTDLDRVTTNQTVHDAIKAMMVKVLKHLYLDGPYRKSDPVAYDPSKMWRCPWYLFHGGTVLNPAKFEHGGWGLQGLNAGEVADQRQGNGPLIGAYGYAYRISGDPVLLEAGNELWDASYNGTDGIRNNMAADGKGFNQNCNRAGSYPVWAGLPTQPGGQVVTLPTMPTTIPVITAPLPGAVLSGTVSVTGSVSSSVAAVDLIVDGTGAGEVLTSLFNFKLDTTRLTDGNHVLFVRAWDTLGVAHDSTQLSFSVANQVLTPTPSPAPKYSYTSALQPRTDTDMLALLNKNGASGLRPVLAWNGRVYFEKAG